jgi:hypothetical protein
MEVPGRICRSCEQRPAEFGAINLFLQLPMMLMLAIPALIGVAPFPSDSYCQPCADRINFLGLVLWGVFAIVGFVLAVIVLA